MIPPPLGLMGLRARLEGYALAALACSPMRHSRTVQRRRLGGSTRRHLLPRAPAIVEHVARASSQDRLSVASVGHQSRQAASLARGWPQYPQIPATIWSAATRNGTPMTATRRPSSMRRFAAAIARRRLIR